MDYSATILAFVSMFIINYLLAILLNRAKYNRYEYCGYHMFLLSDRVDIDYNTLYNDFYINIIRNYKIYLIIRQGKCN